MDRGIADLSQALKLRPDGVEVYLDRARAWIAKGRLDRAIGDCDRALEQKPELAEALVLRGEAHLQQGDADAAAGDFTQALRIDPKHAPGHAGLGQAALSRAEFHQALGHFDEALRLGPPCPRVLFQRGTVKQLLERHEEALIDFNQAVLLDPSYTPAYCNQRAQLHLRRGEHEQALADYAVVLRLDPSNVTARAGQEQAREALRRATRAAPPPPVNRPARPRRRHSRLLPNGTAGVVETQVLRVGPAAETQVALPAAEFIPVEETPAEPTLQLQPDEAVAAPEAPAAEESGEAPVPQGPMAARLAREQQAAEIAERARR